MLRMTTPRLYISVPLAPHASLTIDDKQAHYLQTVLRKKAGDHLLVFNGTDGEWCAVITGFAKKQIYCELQHQTRTQQGCPDIWLCFAPIKNGHIDFLVEKATELGASELHPIITERTIVTRVNHTKCVANAIEAAEQTERLDVPIIAPYQSLYQLIDGWDAKRTLLFCDETGDGAVAETALHELSAQPLAILIGPEGGFTDKELQLLRSLPFGRALHLGKRILRADTAALAALTLVQYFAGDGKEH
jgi:16S rRNA (uracil1498-N3)-methyltransferase